MKICSIVYDKYMNRNQKVKKEMRLVETGLYIIKKQYETIISLWLSKPSILRWKE